MIAGALYARPSEGHNVYKPKLRYLGGLEHEWVIRTLSSNTSGKRLFIAFEIGALYEQRTFYRHDPSYTIANPTLKVPFVYRLWLGDLVTFGAGMYGAYQLGDPKITPQDDGGVNSGIQAMRKWEVGVLGDVRFYFNDLDETYKMFLSLRYSLGLSRSITPGAKYQEMDVSIGIRLGKLPYDHYALKPEWYDTRKLPDY